MSYEASLRGDIPLLADVVPVIACQACVVGIGGGVMCVFLSVFVLGFAASSA